MTQDELPILGAAELAALARAQRAPCTCVVGLCQGWESMSNDRWPAPQMPVRGTLRRPLQAGETEPTFEEFHPDGTRYESPRAPIAPGHFPFNRCDVHVCTQCGSAVLRYIEFGGYYVDPRVRVVRPELIVEA